MGIWHDKGDEGRSFIHGIRHEGSLWTLLCEFLEAYKARTEMMGSQANVAADLALLKEEVSTMHGLTFEIKGKVEELMATQEERLQAILVAVKNVKQMLADLKVSNPAIEDEIAAIEAELAPAAETPPES